MIREKLYLFQKRTTIMSDILKIIEKIDLKNQASIDAALAEAMNDNNLKVGSKVTSFGDGGQTNELDGQVGTIQAINNGYADVKYDNLARPVPLLLNMLLPAS